ncbi:MAG TPA: NADH-quinone oxidoreductase subunit M, partial [Acetobacteraceae bacterium]|nr:NADH-quinone oxidoreductase subunit M [Acetobacteraceae bacterium]
GPMYMLYMYRRMIFGRLTRADLRGMLDLSPREIALFVPLAVLTIWMGAYPYSFTRFWDNTVQQMVVSHQQAMVLPNPQVKLAEAAR